MTFLWSSLNANNCICKLCKHNVIHIRHNRMWFISGFSSLFTNWLASSVHGYCAGLRVERFASWLGHFVFLCYIVGRPFVKRSARYHRNVVCLSVCLSGLSVTLVYCGQTVGRTKVKLWTQVGLGPSHITLDGDSAPPQSKRHSNPIFGPYLLWPNGWMDQDATW